MLSRLAFDFLASNAMVGFVAGSAITCFGKSVKAEVVVGWRILCAFGHRMHIAQTRMDDTAIAAIDRARPLIDSALDQARTGLVQERAMAVVVEADITPQCDSLMPKPVEAAPLPAPAVAVAVVTAP